MEDEITLEGAVWEVAMQLKRLGNNDASTHFGAIEGLAMQIKEGLDSMASATGDVASSLDRIADAINGDDFSAIRPYPGESEGEK